MPKFGGGYSYAIKTGLYKRTKHGINSTVKCAEHKFKINFTANIFWAVLNYRFRILFISGGKIK